MRKLNFLILLSILLFNPSLSLAHPGRTDSSGCHTCRTNCPSWGLSTGEYHCHNAKPATTQTVTPQKSNDQIAREAVTARKADYQSNHLGFRERLIDELSEKLSLDKNFIAYRVYTLLADIKN